MHKENIIKILKKTFTNALSVSLKRERIPSISNNMVNIMLTETNQRAKN